MKGQPFSVSDMSEACMSLRCNPIDLWTVIEVETKGFGFNADRTVKCLFERHIFHRLTNGRFDAAAPSLSSPKPGGYGPEGSQLDRFYEAAKYDRAAAIRATSWGLGQIMGFNSHHAGYDDPEEMVSRFKVSERFHLMALVRVIKEFGLAEALQFHDWRRFARWYNGPDAERNGYDKKLKEAFDRLGRPGALPNITVRALQADLLYRGFYSGKVDGIEGPLTLAAEKEAREVSAS